MEYRNQGKFLSLFETNKLIKHLSVASAKEIHNFCDAVRSVYSFSNLWDVYSADLETVSGVLDYIEQNYGTTFVYEKNIPWIARNIDFVIPDVDNPKILIEVSYMVTTGSGQTTKQRDEHQTRLRINDYNRNNREIVIL